MREVYDVVFLRGCDLGHWVVVACYPVRARCQMRSCLCRTELFAGYETLTIWIQTRLLTLRHAAIIQFCSEEHNGDCHAARAQPHWSVPPVMLVVSPMLSTTNALSPPPPFRLSTELASVVLIVTTSLPVPRLTLTLPTELNAISPPSAVKSWRSPVVPGVAPSSINPSTAVVVADRASVNVLLGRR